MLAKLLSGVLAAMLCNAGQGADESSGHVRYDHLAQRLSAEVKGWPMEQVLQHLAQTTHWRILVEPEIERTVDARFRDAPVGDGLRRLFGPLSFAYVPGSAGAVKLLVFSSDSKAATSLVATIAAESDGGSKRIEDELILRVPPGYQGDLEELARSLGAEIIGRLDEHGAYQLKFETAEAAQSARDRLKAEGRLDAQDNYVIDRPNDSDTRSPLAVPALGLTARPIKEGDGVVIAVIDTPVQIEGTVLKDFLLPGISVAGEVNPPTDTLSHGTSMASTILNGVATSPAAAGGTPVRILPVDVYGNSETTSSFAIAQGMQAAIFAGADVINLSLGGEGGSPLVHDVIRSGQAQGVVFVAAAGNEPVNTPMFPAAYPEVVAVTAMDRSGNVAPYANYGDFVDLLAPGLSYVSYQGQRYYVMGTSAAAANTSGQAANLIVTQGLRGAELETALRQANFPAVKAP